MPASDEMQGFYDRLHAEQAEFIQRSRSRSIKTDDLFQVGKNSEAARLITEHYRARTEPEELQDELIAHRIADASGTGANHFKRHGTRTVRAYVRRELTAPGLYAIEPEHWQVLAGLYQLRTESGRTPLHLLRLREMFETELTRAQNDGKASDDVEKAAREGLLIIDVIGDGLLASDKGQTAYSELVHRLGQGASDNEGDSDSGGQ